MAEFENPRRKRPGKPSDAGDEVYELADDDDPSGPSEAPDLEGPELADGLDERPAPSDLPRPARSESPAAAPLPRLWKVGAEAPEPERPAKKAQSPAPKPESPESRKPAAPGRSGHRREGGEIERLGQVRKPAESNAKGTPSRPADRPTKKAALFEKAPAATNEEPKVLIEATPSLDTYEARQAARVIFGLAILGICAATGLGIGWFFMNRSSNVPDPDAIPVVAVPVAPTGPSPEMLEQEARSLFERARDAAKKKDAKLAVELLERVVSSYPNTPAAREAKEALAHPAQNLPLFVDRPVVVASAAQAKGKAKAPAEVVEPNVVEATAPEAPKAGSAEVGLVYPPNPAEPPRNPAPPPAEKEAAPIGRPLPAGFHARPGTMVSDADWPLEIVGDRDGAPMVLVPGGEVLMGQDDGDPNEQPAHRVRLSTYYVDQHEVTVRQFDLFQAEVGRRTDRVRALAREKVTLPSSDDSPVVMVSAKEAKDFATWAGKRLPTEAQWEMAARGPDGRPYPWGIQPPSWKGKREPRPIDPVMSFAEDVSPYGAYDMAGNAWEWTKDWFDSRYYVYLVKNGITDDPTGPTIPPRARQLTVRGSSKTWGVTRREALKFEQRLPFLGFRCVLPVEGPDNAFQPPPKAAPPPGAPATVGGAGDAAPPPF